jgi:hypothetical protein
MLSRIQQDASLASFSSYLRPIRSGKCSRWTPKRVVKLSQHDSLSLAFQRSLTTPLVLVKHQISICRWLSTKLGDEEPHGKQQEGEIAQLRTGPGSGQAKATPEQIIEYLRASGTN